MLMEFHQPFLIVIFLISCVYILQILWLFILFFLHSSSGLLFHFGNDAQYRWRCTVLHHQAVIRRRIGSSWSVPFSSVELYPLGSCQQCSRDLGSQHPNGVFPSTTSYHKNQALEDARNCDGWHLHHTSTVRNRRLSSADQCVFPECLHAPYCWHTSCWRILN